MFTKSLIVYVIAMLTIVLFADATEGGRSTVCVITKCVILLYFHWVHRCRPANFRCPVKVNGHNSVRDN